MRKLNLHIIANQLNQLCKILSDDYNINSGGCCYVASIIAKHFDRLGLKYEIRVYDNCGKNLKAIRQEVLNKHRNNSAVTSITGFYTSSHYFLFLEGAGSINEGITESGRWKLYSIANINHTNIRWIYKVGQWNNEYNISNNRIIKKIIDSYFKRYEIYQYKN